MKKHILLIFFAIVIFIPKSNSQTYYFKNIDVNNINATITPSSDMFWDFQNPGFEVPIGSGLHSIFAAGLWMGGVDNTGVIHMAAQTYRQTGNDFWPGPIDTAGIGSGPISPTNYLNYNTPWKVNQSEIDDHIQNYTNVNYVVPPNIAEWPGYDTTVERVLAPFADFNGNQIYDPENGDYPFILGDQSVYAVFNDLPPHTETGCPSIGVEVHREFWGFNAPGNTALNNSIFCRYYIKKFSPGLLTDFYISLWTDFDLGNAVDDLIGSDMNLEMVYAYNGDVDDDGNWGYGLNPPACGVYFMNQSLSGSVVYDNVNNQPYGNPYGCYDFYNYGSSIWLDNQPITYGANGRDMLNPPTSIMYPGVTDPVFFPTLGEWSEITAGNTPEDRRVLSSIGPFVLDQYDLITFDVGYTWSRATSGGPMASVAQLQADVAGLRIMYNNGALTSLQQQHNPVSKSISIYPNPSSDLVNIQLSGNDKSYDLLVRDAIGRIVYSNKKLTDSNHQVDVSKFAKGVYIVSITQGSSTFSRKLIVK